MPQTKPMNIMYN